MVLAAYGTDGSICVLTSLQLDTATKVINILTPIEEITKDIRISRHKHNISEHTTGEGS